MLGALLEHVLPPRGVLLGESTTLSNLLYLFIISGIARAILATLLARRVRELRKPRRAMSAPALVLRVTGLNAMVGRHLRLHRPAAERGRGPRRAGRGGAAQRRSGELEKQRQ